MFIQLVQGIQNGNKDKLLSVWGMMLDIILEIKMID